MTHGGRVIILDDFFPNPLTGFRIAEFTWMMRHDIVQTVYTTQPLEPLIESFGLFYPDLVDRVQPYAEGVLEGADLVSTMFLNNAAHFLPTIERQSTPFVVTLYPGGGLNLGDASAGAKLRRVLQSEMLRHVITTQPRVTEYVHSHAPAVPLTEIYGVAVNPTYFGPGAGNRTNYFDGDEHGELRACFVAHKYHTGGIDKGLDVFVETVRLLRDRGVPVAASIVGDFEPEDANASDLSEVLRFLGPLPTHALKAFFAEMDLVIAPNRPNILNRGAFDGFPTGSTVEAALCGVAIIATDQLDQNRIFQHGRDALIVSLDPSDIADHVQALLRAPGGVRRLAQAGLATTRRAYGINAQLWPRRAVLESALNRPRN